MLERSMILLGALVLAACNADNGGPEAQSSLSNNTRIPDDVLGLLSASPVDSSLQRSLASTIAIEFNHPILAASFDDNLITVKAAGNNISGQLESHSPSRFEFTPDNLLPPNTMVTVTVGAGVMSDSGISSEAIEWQFSTTGNLGDTPQLTIDSCMNEQDMEMLASVNNSREQSRLCGDDSYQAVKAIRWNCVVAEAAEIHSNDMAGMDFFSHTGSDGSSSGIRVQRLNYEWSWVGENIAAGQRDVETVMEGWLESEGHCRNIMSPNFTEFGFGYAESSQAQYSRYWTQVFATPSR